MRRIKPWMVKPAHILAYRPKSSSQLHSRHQPIPSNHSPGKRASQPAPPDVHSRDEVPFGSAVDGFAGVYFSGNFNQVDIGIVYGDDGELRNVYVDIELPGNPRSDEPYFRSETLGPEDLPVGPHLTIPALRSMIERTRRIHHSGGLEHTLIALAERLGDGDLILLAAGTISVEPEPIEGVYEVVPNPKK